MHSIYNIWQKNHHKLVQCKLISDLTITGIYDSYLCNSHGEKLSSHMNKLALWIPTLTFSIYSCGNVRKWFQFLQVIDVKENNLQDDDIKPIYRQMNERYRSVLVLVKNQLSQDLITYMIAHAKGVDISYGQGGAFYLCRPK